MKHFLLTFGNKALSQALLPACVAGGAILSTTVTVAADADQQKVQSDYQSNSTASTPQNEASQQQQGQRQQQDQQRGMASEQQQNQSEQQDQQQGMASKQQRSSEGGSADQTEAPDAIVSVIAITEVPVIELEQLMDQEVINYKGETIGDVDQIITNPDGTVAGVAVGAGGILGLGETDLFAPADELHVGSSGVVWQTHLDQETLQNLPQYQLEQYSVSE